MFLLLPVEFNTLVFWWHWICPEHWPTHFKNIIWIFFNLLWKLLRLYCEILNVSFNVWILQYQKLIFFDTSIIKKIDFIKSLCVCLILFLPPCVWLLTGLSSSLRYLLLFKFMVHHILGYEGVLAISCLSH